MITIIAGSRDITDKDVVLRAVIDSGFPITEVVSGGARGIDKLGEEYAEATGKPVRKYPAKWDEYGKAAGMIRNKEMATESGAEALIAIWDGKSNGTRNMINEATKAGLKVFVYTPTA